MSTIEVKVPQLSESVSEATLLTWNKKVGDDWVKVYDCEFQVGSRGFRTLAYRSPSSSSPTPSSSSTDAGAAAAAGDTRRH